MYKNKFFLGNSGQAPREQFQPMIRLQAEQSQRDTQSYEEFYMTNDSLFPKLSFMTKTRLVDLYKLDSTSACLLYFFFVWYFCF